MPVGFTIRVARESDAAAIAHVHVASWRAGYRGLLSDELLEQLSVSEREGMWRRALADESAARGGRQVEVAVTGDALLGFVSVGPSREHDASAHIGEIYALYVEPTHWSVGVGQALLNAAVAHLESIGMGEARLWVLASNAHACRFYELAGWSHDGRIRRERLPGLPDFDAEVGEVCYRRVLKPAPEQA